MCFGHSCACRRDVSLSESCVSLLPAESPTIPQSHAYANTTFAPDVMCVCRIGSCVSKIDFPSPRTKPLLMTHVPSLPSLGGGSQKLRTSPSSCPSPLHLLPLPGFRAFQFRMAAVDEYAYQTPMRRCQAFSLSSWHRIILFTQSLSSASRFLVDRRQPIRQGLAGLGKAWLSAFAQVLVVGLCGLGPSRRHPPLRVGLQDLGGPIPTAGYVNRRSRVSMFSFVAHHKSHTESKDEADHHVERGAKFMENVQYIFR